MFDNININTIRCFIKVAEVKNITMAAEELFLTQPTLSRKLAKLESEVGKVLFRRTTKGIELTSDGLLFYEQSRRLISALDDLQQAQVIEKSITGTIKVGYQRPTLDLVTEFNSHFAKTYPEVELNVQKLGKQNVVNELLFGNLDVAIIYEHELRNFQKVINSFPVGSCKMAVMVSHNHPLATRNVIHLAELKEDRFILLDRNIAPVKIEEFYEHCQSNGFVPNVIRVEREHLDIVTDIVTFNAVSLAPISRKNHSNDMPVDESIKYIDLEGFDTDYPVNLAWPAANTNPVLHLYVNLVQKLVASE